MGDNGCSCAGFLTPHQPSFYSVGAESISTMLSMPAQCCLLLFLESLCGSSISHMLLREL